jgi:hypothetical protein
MMKRKMKTKTSLMDIHLGTNHGNVGNAMVFTWEEKMILVYAIDVNGKNGKERKRINTSTYVAKTAIG